MASFFGEITLPSTRALFEDCSDEESNEKSKLTVVWKTEYKACLPKFKKFVVVDRPLTLAFVEAYVLDVKHLVVGEIHVQQDTDSELELKATPSPLVVQDDLLLCFVHPTLPSNSAFDFADLVSPLARKAEEVIILTSQPASSYKTLPGESPPENAVYSIASSKSKGAALKPVPSDANILTGISAGVASWCEVNNISAVVYVCYSDSAVLDSVTAFPLLGVLPQRQNSPSLKRRWLYGGWSPSEAGASEPQLTEIREGEPVRRRLDMDSRQAVPPKPEIVSIDELEDLRELPDDSIIDTPRSVVTVQRSRSDRDKKLGHRRVRQDGHTTYKKVQTTQIMGSIQLGIQHAVGGLASKPERDVLMQDFMTEETYNFPSMGSNHTPAHHYSEFRFKNYAPIAFRYFRELFAIQPDDFLITMCSAPLVELSNPGASGSIFYLTDDDELILKTVQHKEGEFLQKLLPGYYLNLNQNPRTLLPKFFGLYCYQVTGKNIRLVVMNNLLPSHVKMHQKYDLKGSTYKRKANKAERAKASPTYKDLDFMEHHPDGLFLEPDTYQAVIKTIQRDCRVLESFKIMDYSLLVGIHILDADGDPDEPPEGLNRSRSMRQRVMTHATPMESIQARSDDEEDLPTGGIPARNAKGERLLLYIGIIDILQSYKFKKMLEHTWKSLIHDGDTVSVHRPDFYAQRFQDFMGDKVFKKSMARMSTSKRRSVPRISKQERPPPHEGKSCNSMESTSSTSGIGSSTGYTGSTNGCINAELDAESEVVRHVTRILVKS